MPKPPPLSESSPAVASGPPSGAQPRHESKEAPSASRGLEAVLDPVPGAWFFTRRDGTFAYVSLGACAWLGYTRAEVRNLRIFDIDPRMTCEHWDRMWSTTRPPDSLTVRTVHRRKDGTLSPVEIRAVRVYIDGEDLAVSYSVDLKETEEARQALVATQAELQRLLDHVPDLIFRLRAAPTPRLSFVSPSSVALLGYAPDELVGSDVNLDFGSNTDRPSVVATGGVASPFISGATFLPANVCPGIPGPFGCTGDLGRNPFNRPGFIALDLRVSRRINFSDRWSMDVIADAFNLFNRFNVGDVNPLCNPLLGAAGCRAGEPTGARRRWSTWGSTTPGSRSGRSRCSPASWVG